jgi:uncharacterized membrane protein YraQ (UPF0718 family)
MNKKPQIKDGGMSRTNNPSKRIVSVKTLAVLMLAVAAAGALIILYPENRGRVFDTSRRFLTEMVTILPAMVILIGLFSVFVSKKVVTDYLGHASGFKGVLLSFILGALPTGPLYVAFPLAAAMRRMGARYANIIIFLTAWACVKLPQELVELQFMGLEFMAARFGLTIVAAVVMGLIVERVMGDTGEMPSGGEIEVLP